MNKHEANNVFGMDKEHKEKWQAKFDPVKEAACKGWLQEVLGETFAEDSLHLALKDGTRLCRALNIIWKLSDDYNGHKKIKSKFTKKYELKNPQFKHREAIGEYLRVCKEMGMSPGDCFVVNDLYEDHNLVIVIDQIYCLGSLAQKVGASTVTNQNGVPEFGKKTADKNKREFTKEQIQKGKQIVPLQNAGSIAVEKEKGTDAIVKYGKCGTDLGKSVGGVSQQNSGSIAVEKSKGTDHIVKYANVGQEMGKSCGGVSQQNAGSIAVEKEKGTDHIVKYGKVGQEMGKSHGGTSQQNAGSVYVEKAKGTDHIVKYGKVGQELGESVGGTSQINEGSLETSKENKLDSISRALN